MVDGAQLGELLLAQGPDRPRGQLNASVRNTSRMSEAVSCPTSKPTPGVRTTSPSVTSRCIASRTGVSDISYCAASWCTRRELPGGRWPDTMFSPMSDATIEAAVP